MESAVQAVVADVREEAIPAPAGREHKHMPSLDGLRGVAILLVLLHHLTRSLDAEFVVNRRFSNWSELGWTGVDLFFVLSGFLITGILYDAKNSSNFFKNFYMRRAIRIFPLYYIALAIVMLFTPLLVYLKLTGTQNPAWLSIYATNFVISAKGFGSFGVLDHFWSLAVEEHFYLIWPAVVYFLPRKKLMLVAACACVIAPALRFSLLNGTSELPTAAYILTPMRMDSLAAGAFIALFVRGSKRMDELVKPAMITGALSLVAFLSMCVVRNTKSHHDAVLGTCGYSVLYLLFGSTLVLALAWGPLRSLMSAPILRWFGKYSYGMYVWHPIIFILVFHNDFARDVRNGDGLVQGILSGAVGIGLMFAVTLASWHLWEKQFLKLKPRFA